jgi:ATP-dependent DNA helicase RecG
MREKVGEKVGENITLNQEKILEFILSNNKITAHELSKRIEMSQRKIEVNLRKLKTAGLIQRIGPAKGGYWKLVTKKKS